MIKHITCGTYILEATITKKFTATQTTLNMREIESEQEILYLIQISENFKTTYEPSISFAAEDSSLRTAIY